MLRLAAEDLTSVAAGPGQRTRRARTPRSPARLPGDLEPRLGLRRPPRRAGRRPRAARARRVRAVLGGCVAGLAVRAPARLRLPGVAGARRPRSACPGGRAYPAVPVLVLNGDLDVITPIADAARAAALFPNATLVRRERRPRHRARGLRPCASGIVRRFLRTRRRRHELRGAAGRAARRPGFPRTRRRRPPRSAAPATRRTRATAAPAGRQRTRSRTRSHAGG